MKISCTGSKNSLYNNTYLYLLKSSFFHYIHSNLYRRYFTIYHHTPALKYRAISEKTHTGLFRMSGKEKNPVNPVILSEKLLFFLH